MDRRTLLGGSIAALGLAACAQDAPAQTSAPPPAAAPDPENTLILEIPSGRVTIQMLPDLAPNHVARIKTLVRQGFYDNTPFHRVIDGFMAQGGDPTGTGTGGSRLPDLAAEFVPASRARFVRGTVGMARTANPNSANSQFFIMFAPNQGLDGQYTIWGRVIAGMDAVDRIKRGAPGSGTVTNPDRIRTARIAADAR
ncbi:MAG TPA: peptidylprolyl isomerase [Roseomonas sp.]|nr:peptidylprolyl isomerase [Roseomonas sp.]